MRRLVEAPLKDFSKDLHNGARFLMKLHVTLDIAQIISLKNGRVLYQTFFTLNEWKLLTIYLLASEADLS